MAGFEKSWVGFEEDDFECLLVLCKLCAEFSVVVCQTLVWVFSNADVEIIEIILEHVDEVHIRIIT